jgi:predicted N-acetyltransferase YhbS
MATKAASKSRKSAKAKSASKAKKPAKTKAAGKSKKSGVKLRPPRPDDAAAVGTICYEAFAVINDTHGFPPDFPSADAGIGMVSMMIGRPDVYYGVVAELDGRVVGSNFMSKVDPVHGVGPITVDPNVQNKAIGRALMEDVMNESAKLGAASIRLVQASFHNRSLSLYTKLGFDVREPLSAILGPPLNRQLPGFKVRKATKKDIPACNALHERLHGYRRNQDLIDAIDQGTASVVERNGEIVGYATSIAFFGSAIATDNDALKALIAATPELEHPGFLLPTRNADVMRWCLANGMRVMQPMNLMTMGLYNEPRGAFLPSILF